MKFLVEVRPSKGFSDPRTGWILARCRELNLPVDRVETARLFELEGPYAREDAEKAASLLLADPVTESYSIGAQPPGARGVRIEVWYRPGVTDPAAESVEQGLKDLGLPKADRVRCGQGYSVSGPLGREEGETLARKALANPIVHRWEIRPY